MNFDDKTVRYVINAAIDRMRGSHLSVEDIKGVAVAVLESLATAPGWKESTHFEVPVMNEGESVAEERLTWSRTRPLTQDEQDKLAAYLNNCGRRE